MMDKKKKFLKFLAPSKEVAAKLEGKEVKKKTFAKVKK